MKQLILGTGISAPMRRGDGSDFASSSAEDSVYESIAHILGTPVGTYPWNMEFGNRLRELKHKNNTFVLREMARVFVVEAIATWERRARLLSVTVEPAQINPGRFDTLYIRVTYDIISLDTGDIITPGIEQEVVAQL